MAGKAGDADNRRVVKISELPVYGNPEVKTRVLPEEIGKFRECISVVRQTVGSLLSPFKGAAKRAHHVYETGKSHSKSSLDYVWNEEGMLIRLTAIVLSGVAGNMLARKGVLRKTTFTTFGLLAATSLCFPNKAVSLTTQQYDNLKTKALELWKSIDSEDKS